MEAARVKTLALNGVNEALAARIWERQLLLPESLVTDTGMPVQVVYPGRRSHDGGPDYRHAIIAIADASLWRGDVEVHVRASDWEAHGHHRDPRYNGTVLHVVLHGDHLQGTVLQSGGLVPTLALEDCLSAPLESLLRKTPPSAPEPWPCRQAIAALGCRGLEKRLDEAGDARFRDKAAGFEADLACQDPAQALYEGLMTALGYANNKEPFRELARRAPLAVLEGLALGKRREQQLQVIQALLLGAGGLLPAQRRPPVAGDAAGYVAGLEEIWCGLKQDYEPLPWRWGGSRPENLPPRRIAGMAHLLARHMEKGLLAAILGCAASGPGEAIPGLESALTAPAAGFWAEHADFGLPASLPAALIGRGRAREAIVNVVLPFLYAYAQAISRPPLAQRAREIYGSCPPLPENQITREMGRLLAGKRKFRPSARRQQGMIRLFKAWCLERRCEDCPLGG